MSNKSDFWKNKSVLNVKSPIGSAIGYELPDTTSLLTIQISHDETPRLLAHGIIIEGGFRGNNTVAFDPSGPKVQLRINLSSYTDNLIVLERGCNIRNNCHFNIEGNNHTIVIREAHGLSRLTVTMRGNGGVFYYGRNCTSNYTNCLVQGSVSLCIGEDCMFAVDTTIRTYDSHAIIDLTKCIQINDAHSIAIGRHVWVGQNSILMPSITIGDGSIIGAGSIVTKSIPTKTLAVGIPAKVIRENVSWTRDSFPNKEQIDKVIDFIK
jgi:acetyltransferase-like isoleucine patch superfamily enzyme